MSEPAKPETTFGEYLKRQSEKTFRRSDSIAKLADALSKAQGAIESASKNAENPYFKSHYADLASVWEVIRKPFSESGIAIMQPARSQPVGNDGAGIVEVETVLAHSSGEWVAETLAMPVARYDAHGVGSAISYAKRYSLMAFAGVAAEDDDDGNGATDPKKLSAINSLRNSSLALLTTASNEGLKALTAAWKSLTPAAQKACEGDKARLEAIKETAKNTDKMKGAQPAGLKGHGGNKPEPTNPVMELQDHILVECKCGWEHFKVAAVGSFWPEAVNAHSFADVPTEFATRWLRDKDGLKQKVQLVRDSMKKKEVAT